MKIIAISHAKRLLYAYRISIQTMKISSTLLLTCSLLTSAAAYGQKVNLSLKNVKVEYVLKELRKQTGAEFLYSNQELDRAKLISIQVSGKTLEEVLKLCFAEQPFTYTIRGKSVIIRPIILSPERKPSDTKLDKYPIKGKVLNTNGEVLRGITVTIKGSNLKALTNDQGEFEIEATTTDNVLICSCVGYTTRQISVQNEFVVVRLEPKVSQLDEVVLVGYGTVERRNNLGAVGSFKPKAIGALPNSIDGALVGRIAGLQVLPSSGVPGAAPVLSIRGITSINGKGNPPLIVIDGVPMYGVDPDANTVNFSGRSYNATFTGNAKNTMTQNQRETFERNPLSLINPEDIESIEVLKDAYSTAIYGSRGASGVILIKTKQGKAHAPTIDAQFSTSLNTPVKKHVLMNGDQYADFYTTYFKTQNKNLIFPKGVNTDWLDEIYRTGESYNASFNISNGNDKGNYYLSGSYTDDKPYVIKNNYNRYSGRLNLNQSLSRALRVGANMALSTTKNNALNANLLYGDAAITASNKPIYDNTGNYIWATGPNPVVTTVARDLNAVGYANTTTNYVSDNNIVGNIFAELDLLKWAKFKSEFGVDWETSRAFSRYTNRPRTVGGLASETQTWRRKWVVNNTLNINHRFGFHGLNAVVGQSFEASVENSTNVTGNNFPNDQVLSITSAGTRTFGNALQQQWALFSVFGRFNYSYKNKYMAGITYRIDGSSKFSEDRRYVGFPSFSLGWDLKQEPFMKHITFVDQFKVRSSLGLSGSDGGAGYYGNKGIYANPSGNPSWAGDVVIVPTIPNNPDLKWETRTKYNVGTDIALFNSALGLTVDYYNEKTDNAILSFPIPSFLGFNMQQQNVGVLRNKGIEITFNADILKKDDFSWNTMLTVSKNRNRIERLFQKNGITDPLELGRTLEAGTGKFLMEGQSATAFFLYEWAGVNPNNGNPLWVDKNGNKTEVNIQLPKNGWDEHRKLMGDATPKVFGGWDNIWRYKGLEMNVFLTYAIGNKMINGAKAYLYSYTSNEANNLSTDLLDYWKEPGQHTAIPALLNESNSVLNPISGVRNPLGTDYTLGRNTSRFLEEASYLKVKNVTIGYNFDSHFLKSANIQGIKLYLQMDNALIFTKYTGIDPEVSAFGSSALQVGRDEFTLPPARSIRLGAKLRF